MELKTNNKTIILVFTTRKIVKVTNLLKGKNFEDLYFEAMNEGNLDALSKIIYIFAEDKDGIPAFTTSENVYEFLDDYKKDNDKTYEDIYNELAVAINEEGFFRRKMNKKELAQKTSDILSGINLNNLIKNSAEKIITQMAEQEMTIQKK